MAKFSSFEEIISKSARKQGELRNSVTLKLCNSEL